MTGEIQAGPRWILAFRVLVSLFLLSRGWLTWKWDSPIRSIVWHEDWMSPLLEGIANIAWNDFARNSEPTLTHALEGVGIALMLLAAVPWLSCMRGMRWTIWLLVPATVIVILDSAGRWIGADYEIGMAIEHSLQMVTPLAFLILVRRKCKVSPRVVMLLLVASALTFIGHGLYALGFHDVPLKYVSMTTRILKCDADSAMTFLMVAGILDLVVAFLLFLPKGQLPALIYMVAWGGLTSLARIAAHLPVLDPWLLETLVRTPHWAVPFLLFLLLKTKQGKFTAPQCDRSEFPQSLS